MSTSQATADVHCPDCGAITRAHRDDEWLYLVCTNDDCPTIIVQVNERPAE